MSDIAMTADTPAEAAPPPAEEAVSPPNPIHDEPHQDAEVKPEVKAEKKLTARESLEAAAKKVEAVEKAEVDKAKPPAEVKPRDETGKFAPKAKEGEDAAKPGEQQPQPGQQQAPHHEPPTRFSAEAKAKWAEVDEGVKQETHRAIRELEQGFTKYRQAATDYETYRPFHELARSLNVDPGRALQEYVTIDKLLSENFIGGLERIAQNKGVSLQEVAQHILGQQPGQQQPAHPQVQRLEQQVAMLAHQLQQVTGTVTGGIEKQVSDEVTAFAADKPLFDELSKQIAGHIANDGLSLPDAYDRALSDAQAMAQRLGFIPRTQASAPPAPSSDVDLEAQTRKGQKSIAGAPSAGSAPATHKPSSSIKDAVRKAMQAAAGV